MATVAEIMDALGTQIESELAAVDGLQVVPRLWWNPTPPSIDIYPASPFQEGIAMGEKQLYLVVRARVNTPDHDGAQDLLLDLMDPKSTNSVEQAIRANPTLGGLVDDSAVLSGSPSDFGAFSDPGSTSALLGCTWTVAVIP